jgi:hypothetical protein
VPWSSQNAPEKPNKHQQTCWLLTILHTPPLTHVRLQVVVTDVPMFKFYMYNDDSNRISIEHVRQGPFMIGATLFGHVQTESVDDGML